MTSLLNSQLVSYDFGLTNMRPNDSRDLPGDCDSSHGWQGFFAAPSGRRERSDSRVRFTRGWAAQGLYEAKNKPNPMLKDSIHSHS